MRRSSVVSCSLLAVLLWASSVSACGIDFSFRSYLDKRFWQPLSKYEEALGLQNAVPRESSENVAYAGMNASGASPALQRLRDAYREEEPAKAREYLALALDNASTPMEKEEAQLIDAKLDMRAGEAGEPVLLASAEKKLHQFLEQAQISKWRSEARGWLGRIFYLQGRYADAAKIYLDELHTPDSIISRSSLISSLKILFPYNGSSSRLADHLEEYFDTPGHALFAVTIATNPIYFDEDERELMAETANKALSVLQHRQDLFVAGDQSEALTLALIRASLYMGDAKTAVAFAEKLDPHSPTAQDPDYNWMLAACSFLLKDYAAAEEPLLKAYNSPKSDLRQRSAAAQGLMGVYLKLGRHVDMLQAAFMADLPVGEEEPALPWDGMRNGFVYWPTSDTSLELAYLLDVQLTDDELRQYLEKYGSNAHAKVLFASPRRRTATETVLYALAVRYARHEEFAQAAHIYEQLRSRPRATRMRELQKLYDKTKVQNLPRAAHLEARFAYASYLADHSTQIFFNDMVWYGFQTMAMIGKTPSIFSRYDYNTSSNAPGLTLDELHAFQKRERAVRDSQEEYWQAYTILSDVIKKAGTSELAARARIKALHCLRMINKDRFERQDDIDAAFRSLGQAPDQHSDTERM